jgi:cyclopropane fatty-acyl-phospholipid synthase-like methyltransferase
MTERFPRTAKYDPKWIEENKMGPNPLYLLEDLCKDMTLEPGMKVLDMGCGKAITSIFLAKEYGVQVWANDLWISPTDNWQRIKEAGVEDLVYPIKGEARSLPYAAEFFDAIVSIDAYHYFGTDETYLFYYFHKLVKRGGQIGIAVPGLTREFGYGLPENLRPYWDTDMFAFHSAAWWENHFAKTGLVKVEFSTEIEDSKRFWLEANCDNELLLADKDDYLTFVKLLATRI